MKKMTRMMAGVLAVVMLVSVMALTAFAADSYDVHVGIYGSNHSKFGNPHVGGTVSGVPGGKGHYIAPSHQFRIKDQYYDMTGSIRYAQDSDIAHKGISNGKYVQALPENAEGRNQIMFAYAPHHHRLSPNAPWRYDDNNHWKECETCPCWLFMNWHHDVDNDGVCDECHQPIVYRNLSVKDTEGGKVTISTDKGTVGNRVAVTVVADPGYKLVDIRGMNTTAKKYSYRPCIVDVKGSQYHFFIDVYDVEVVAKFVKE